MNITNINWVKKKLKICNQFKYRLNGNYQVLKNILSLIENILFDIKIRNLNKKNDQ